MERLERRPSALSRWWRVENDGSSWRMNMLSIFVREGNPHEAVRVFLSVGRRDGILENLHAARRCHRRRH